MSNAPLDGANLDGDLPAIQQGVDIDVEDILFLRFIELPHSPNQECKPYSHERKKNDGYDADSKVIIPKPKYTLENTNND